MNEIDKDALMHHGIKGQKWGVQNGPPYPLDSKNNKKVMTQIAKKGRPKYMREDHTIPKGTRLYRVSPKEKESLSGYKYVTYLPVDRDLYRGRYVGGLMDQYGLSESDAYEHEFELTQDLRIPSREKLKQVTREIMDDEKVKKETVKAMILEQGRLAGFDPASERLSKATGKKNYEIYKKQRDDYIRSYIDIFNGYYDKQKIHENGWYNTVIEYLGGSSPIIKRKLFDELSKEGYNAIVDEATSKGIGNYGRQGIEALIIFNGSNLVTNIGSHKITDEEARSAEERYNQWNRIANKRKYVNKTEW